jgi:hypothetical protein
MGSIHEKNQRSTISCYCTFKAAPAPGFFNKIRRNLYLTNGGSMPVTPDSKFWKIEKCVHFEEKKNMKNCLQTACMGCLGGCEEVRWC